MKFGKAREHERNERERWKARSHRKICMHFEPIVKAAIERARSVESEGSSTGFAAEGRERVARRWRSTKEREHAKEGSDGSRARYAGCRGFLRALRGAERRSEDEYEKTGRVSYGKRGRVTLESQCLAAVDGVVDIGSTVHGAPTLSENGGGSECLVWMVGG